MTVGTPTDAGPAAAGPTAPAARGRFSAADAALLGGGAVLTAAIAAAATRRPSAAVGLLAVVALTAVVIFGRKRFARARVGTLLTALLVSLPLLALLGPSFALPAAPQAFLFRIVLAVVDLRRHLLPAVAPRPDAVRRQGPCCCRRCCGSPGCCSA